MERMEREGERVMAAGRRDLDPAAFDPDGDLLAYVTDLEMTSLVGMVDPPRESRRPRWPTPRPPTSGSGWSPATT